MISRTPLLRFYEEAYRICRHPDGAIATRVLYQTAISQFQSFLGRPGRIKDLTQDRLAAFLAWLAVNHRPAGANTYVKKLLALARFAFRKRLLREEPDVCLLREFREVPRAYRPKQMGRLLVAASLAEGECNGIPARLYWPAKIQVMYWTGLRIGAALQIAQENVDLEAGTILVLAQTQKQRAGQIFRVHSDCIEAIRQIWLPRRQLLFPWPYTFRIVYNHLRRILVAANLPSSRYDLFQKIRRTTYSYSKLGGIDAGRQLGHHSDLSACYEDPMITQQRQACDVLPRPELPGPNLRVI